MGSITYDRGTNLLDFVSAGKTNVESLRYYFKPKQAEPMTTIEGWDNVKGHLSGKNLFDKEILIANGITLINGEIVGRADAFHAAFYLNNSGVPFNIDWGTNKRWEIQMKLYTEQNATSTGIGLFGQWQYMDGSKNSNYISSNTWNTEHSCTFISEANKTIKCFQLSYGAGGSNIFHIIYTNLQPYDSFVENEPFCGQTLSIDFPSSIYGGYVDPAAGLLVTTYNTIDLGSLSWLKNTTAQFYASLPSDASGVNGWLTPHYCEVYEDTEKTAYNKTKDQTISLSTTRVWVQDSTCDTAAALKTKLDGAIFVYESVKEAQTSITPTPITTCLRENHIWSNTNDKTTCTCVVNDSAAVMRAKKRFAANEPHLEVASGNIASFSTDLKAPLKSCKIEFLPVQEGSGDPSPTNIRPITGWTGLEVTKCGTNLFDIDTVGFVNSRYLNWETGNLVTWGSNWNVSNYVEVFPNTQYTLQCYCYGLDTRAGIAFYNLNKEYISGINVDNTSGISFITPLNTAYMRFTATEPSINPVQLKFGSTPTTYEPYAGTTIPISWTNEGEIYGGYVDLINGELVATMWYEEFTWGTNYDNDHAYDNVEIRRFPLSYRVLASGVQGNTITDMATWYYSYAGDFPHFYTVNGILGPYIYLALPIGTSNDTKFHICYDLETPIIYNLSPSSLKTLIGTNNIWSNTNSTTSVQYWTH